MLVPARMGPLIADGSVDLLFRQWRRSQVVAGRRYRTAAGMLHVSSVDVVEPESITRADARRAGYADAAALLRDLRGEKAEPVFRLQVSAVREPDPRSVLAGSDDLSPDDVRTITARLDRLDRASSAGPWTRPTLAAIERRPATRAGDLAATFGRETAPFKLDVRKLKTMGLTLSLQVGYRLSPRGEAYLRAVRERGTRGAQPGRE